MGLRRRTFFAWHSWIGLTAGLLLFIVCWSGTVAVFSHELDWLADQRLHAPPSEVVAWQTISEKTEAAKPGWHILAISAPLHPGFAAEVWIADPDEVWHRVWADPASGELLGTTSYFNVQRFFRSFHISLFIGGWNIWDIPFGYWLVGLSAIILMVSLITSLIFYRRFWRGFFKLERRRGAKIFWSDLHKLTGLWSLWFVALVAVTGIWYLVEWKVTSEAPVPDPPAVAGSVEHPLPVDVLLARARQAYPALKIRTIVLDQMSSGMFEVQGRTGHGWFAIAVHVSGSTRAMANSSLFGAPLRWNRCIAGSTPPTLSTSAISAGCGARPSGSSLASGSRDCVSPAPIFRQNASSAKRWVCVAVRRWQPMQRPRLCCWRPYPLPMKRCCAGVSGGNCPIYPWVPVQS